MRGAKVSMSRWRMPRRWASVCHDCMDAITSAMMASARLLGIIYSSDADIFAILNISNCMQKY